MRFIFIAFLLLTVTFAHADDGKEANLSATFLSGTNGLTMMGSGTRSKFFMDLYIAKLYAASADVAAEDILSGTAKAAISLDIVSGMITSKKMEDATREGFEDSTGGKLEPISAEIEKFITVFKDEIKEGDSFIFLADEGDVQVYKNQKELTMIHGPEFRKALMGIWLGEDPVSTSLKKSMLGL